VWFEKYGLLVIFVASFTPIPYKVFTIAAGVMSMFFIPFVIVSIIGRGLRFFLVAGLMRWGGEKMENKLKTYIDRIGWAVVFLIVLVIIVLKV
jgi:membrane protein YqaA with SNARE-associated domain